METFCYLCSWLYSTSRDGARTYSVQAKFRASPNHVGCSLSQNTSFKVNILQLLSLHTKRGEACTSTDTVLFTAAVSEYCVEDWVFKIPHVEQNTYFSADSSPRIKKGRGTDLIFTSGSWLHAMFSATDAGQKLNFFYLCSYLGFLTWKFRSIKHRILHYQNFTTRCIALRYPIINHTHARSPATDWNALMNIPRKIGALELSFALRTICALLWRLECPNRKLKCSQIWLWTSWVQALIPSWETLWKYAHVPKPVPNLYMSCVKAWPWNYFIIHEQLLLLQANNMKLLAFLVHYSYCILYTKSSTCSFFL